MKRAISVLLIMISSIFLSVAQIPNNGFETWEDYPDYAEECQPNPNVYQKPDKWIGLLPYNCEYSFSIEKNLESYPAGTGQFSMIVKSDTIYGSSGVAFSYDQFEGGWPPPPAFPINYRPVSLCLYYKYLPAFGDTMGIGVFFYKNGVVIGNPGYGSSQTVSAWTPLIIPMTYDNDEIPDSATIIFATFHIMEHNNSRLYIDNVSFDNLITSVFEVSSKKDMFNVYPNPASEMITITINNPMNEDYEFRIYSVNGSLVKSETFKPNQRLINIGDLSNGIYVAELKSKEWIGTQKLVIQR